MADPSGFGADAAYERAVAAYEQKSFDVARRWVLEALAQNPQHAQARALLGRLDSVRRPPSPYTPAAARPQSSGHAGPEIVSTDPTVLINHASRMPSAEPIEPTVLVRRDAGPPARPASDPFSRPRPAVPDTPAPEPTMIASAPRAAAAQPAPPPRSQTAKRGGFLELFGLGKGPAAAPRRPAATGTRGGGLTPGMRGAALAIGAVVIAGLLLWAAIVMVRSLWPAGQLLTITTPTGGTIVGPGIKCGSNGSDCSMTRPTGDVVQLEPRADNGYLFSGFTGDCAPTTGRILMSEPRKCGAKFDQIAVPAAATTFALTVLKPVGGTIAGDDVLCGSLDNACSANVPSGAKVTMHIQADTNFTLQSWTDDCAPNGEMTMNGPKTCGATFMQTSTTVANNPDAGRIRPPVHVSKPPAPTPADTATTKPAGTDAATGSPAVPAAPPTPTNPGGVQSPPAGGTRAAPPGPVTEAVSEEQHAKDEIDRLVRRYCSEFETLKTDGLKEIFPLAPIARFKGLFHDNTSR